MNNKLYNLGFRKSRRGEEYVLSYSFPILHKTLLAEISITERNDIIVDIWSYFTHDKYYPYYYDWNGSYSVLIDKINGCVKPFINKVNKILLEDKRTNDSQRT